MSDAKQTVRAVLDKLPQDCSLDEILYHLYVLKAVEQGRADVAAGRVLSHEAVAQEMRRKWQVGREQ